MKTRADLVALVADYPGAPEGVERFTWHTVPHTAGECVEVPYGRPSRQLCARSSKALPDRNTFDTVIVRIYRDHEDRHGGVRLWVGWSAEARVGVIWVDD